MQRSKHLMSQTETSQAAHAANQPEDLGVPTQIEEGYAYFEGGIVPLSQAKVSVATHALQYGTACFEGIRAYWNEERQQLYVLKLREHFERMKDSWNILRIRPKESIDDLCNITVELLRKHQYRQNVY